jgi:hypothetical protein
MTSTLEITQFRYPLPGKPEQEYAVKMFYHVLNAARQFDGSGSSENDVNTGERALGPVPGPLRKPKILKAWLFDVKTAQPNAIYITAKNPTPEVVAALSAFIRYLIKKFDPTSSAYFEWPRGFCANRTRYSRWGAVIRQDNTHIQPTKSL